MKQIQTNDVRLIGELRNMPQDWTANGVSINSRELQIGDLFFAIRGERFDGHDFIQDAFRKGVSACVVSKAWFGANQSLLTDKQLVVVDDPLKALQELARRYRERLDLTVIALTGTNGKTTCKEMLHATLSAAYRVQATQGNFNNQIGVPLTLLGLDEDTQIAVVEMGASARNDIRLLCEIARPDSGIVTNVGKAHLQSFGDAETILSTKKELYDYLVNDGVRFVNADLPYFTDQIGLTNGLVTFGTGEDAHYRYRMIETDELARALIQIIAPAGEKLTIRLSVSGLHFVPHVAAAACVAHTLNVPAEQITAALSEFIPLNNRFSVSRVKGITLINDTYNANPDSMRAALETLRIMRTEGKKIAVLGDMLELGTTSREEHRVLGLQTAAAGVDALLTYGDETAETHHAAGSLSFKKHYATKKDMIDALFDMIQPGDLVLVKGSRGMQMDEITEALNG